MSWAPIKKRPPGARDHQVAMSLRHEERRGGHYAYVYIGPEALAALGAAKYTKVRLERGDGEHHGWMRMSKTASGDGHSLSVESGSADGASHRLRLYFRAWPEMAKTEQSSSPCKWRRAGHEMIEIELPTWCFTERAAKVTPLRRMP
jgi:hypothetical protein